MKKYKHLSQDDRSIIQDGLTRGQSFRAIAERIAKDPTTVSKEVKKHGRVEFGFDWIRTPFCQNWEHCQQRDLCSRETCTKKQCRGCRYCYENCLAFEPIHCPKLAVAPYVCNGCELRNTCRNMQMLYSARHAQLDYERIRMEARMGSTFTEQELEAMTQILKPLVKGQSIHHIVSSNRDRLFCSERQIYRLIDQQRIGIKAIDLPRKVRFRPRKKEKIYQVDTGCRIGRTYKDYQRFILAYPVAVVQMDTVEGKRSELDCVLTLYFVNCGFILIFPRQQNTSASVTACFDELYQRLGADDFYKLFPVLLTDRGTEFSNPTRIEYELDQERKTHVFYCDAGQSQQKGSIEQAHTLLRNIVPKGHSLKGLSQEDCRRMASHINSYIRKNLGDKTAYELFEFLYGQEILLKLGMNQIPPREVNLSPELVSPNHESENA